MSEEVTKEDIAKYDEISNRIVRRARKILDALDRDEYSGIDDVVKFSLQKRAFANEYDAIDITYAAYEGGENTERVPMVSFLGDYETFVKDKLKAERDEAERRYEAARVSRMRYDKQCLRQLAQQYPEELKIIITKLGEEGHENSGT